MSFTHIDPNGNAVMVDVAGKSVTHRTAVAVGTITMSPECFAAVQNGTAKKGDVLAVAQIAGIMATKHTADLIPLCHPLPLAKSTVTFQLLEGSHAIEVTCTTACDGKTGVEMEALTGATTALLTIYDMCKAIDRAMVISQVRLLEKHGGKSGDFYAPSEEPMRDRFGREIDYLRISITDRCNLRCKYCMPQGVQLLPHADLLTYEELLRIVSVTASLGIKHYKITGGEPLIRCDCLDFLHKLHQISGVQDISLTTNGLLLEPFLPQLSNGLLSGINLSLDTLDDDQYRALTGCSYPAVAQILHTIDLCLHRGIPTKLNAVLLHETQDQVLPLAALAKDRPLDVRFIEVMPLGGGAEQSGLSGNQVLSLLKTVYPDLHPVQEHRGNGPAHYYASAQLRGRIGLIDAMTHRFCDACNRLRLTSTGQLKPCLCYAEGTDLRALLRAGCTDKELSFAIKNEILSKPKSHVFSTFDRQTEHRPMNQIGG